MSIRRVRWPALLLVSVLACRSTELMIAKQHTWSTLREPLQQWFRLAWGQSMSQAELDREHRRFECEWDALARGGRDPRPDFDCRVRTIRFVLSCAAEGSQVIDCSRRSATVCPTSREYELAARACR